MHMYITYILNTNVKQYILLELQYIHCVPGVSGLGQKYAFIKNPQFLTDQYEILTKEGTHEDFILTKFRNDRVKIVDF